MSEQVWLAVAQIFGGLITGFLVARYTSIAQRTVRKISYTASSIQLFKLHEKTPKGIKIIADKSLITGFPEDSSEQIVIDNAYAHSIIFKNKGNAVAESLFFKIIFGENARIISHNVSPSSRANQGVTTLVPEEQKNILEIDIPYMNPGEPLNISIVRTGTKEDETLSVVGGGKGIEVETFRVKGFPLAFFVSMICLFVVLTLFDSSSGGLGELLPERLVQLLGGSIQLEPVKVASFPTLHKIAGTISAVTIAGAVWWRAARKSSF